MKLIFDQKDDIFHTYDCMLSNFKWLQRGLQEGSKHFTVPSPIQDLSVDRCDGVLRISDRVLT